jgi:hypothetical protein
MYFIEFDSFKNGEKNQKKTYNIDDTLILLKNKLMSYLRDVKVVLKISNSFELIN